MPDEMNRPEPKKSGRSLASKLLVAAGAICLIIYGIMSIPPKKPVVDDGTSASGSASASGEASSASQDDGEPVLYPEGKMILTTAREEYKDGEMTLTVPRLGLEDVAVLSGDSFATMAKGPGLYDYSCLPGEADNANVSIIAHRDIDGKEFYYIDTITTGDLIYLTYKGVKYTYQYTGTTVIKPNNLAIVPCTDKAKVTLVSCHPIGTTLKRIVVTAELISEETLG